MTKSAIVVGAGIVGLATAKALAEKGFTVTVVERTQKAVGASIRNFGMIWPIGQPDGTLYETAKLSRRIWKQVCSEANIWHDEVGSLHTAYEADEYRVLEELAATYTHRGYKLVTPDATRELSPATAEKNLKGGLYSPEEMIVDPRKAIAAIPGWLQEKYKVNFLWGKAVTKVAHPAVHAGDEVFYADLIYVCSGADFETLYPDMYAALPITKCKLQMMRLQAQPDNWRIGPALCGALSLAHYQAFKAASSLSTLMTRFESQYPDYLKHGIHVMVSQNQAGELTVGDSHEYGLNPDPFDRSVINKLILDYLDSFATFKQPAIIETWNGIYPKLTNGEANIVLHPESGVTVINGLGGAGMTLSFGFCDQLIKNSI
ncbi:MAG: TIGR03364 family FAD-dependent oxidoreductase [Niabella sp.]|nr:TIGR03364 family FAD-dependent oxidoreductase [Niabella sp.]